MRLPDAGPVSSSHHQQGQQHSWRPGDTQITGQDSTRVCASYGRRGRLWVCLWSHLCFWWSHSYGLPGKHHSDSGKPFHDRAAWNQIIFCSDNIAVILCTTESVVRPCLQGIAYLWASHYFRICSLMQVWSTVTMRQHRMMPNVYLYLDLVEDCECLLESVDPGSKR